MTTSGCSYDTNPPVGVNPQCHDAGESPPLDCKWCNSPEDAEECSIEAQVDGTPEICSAFGWVFATWYLGGGAMAWWSFRGYGPPTYPGHPSHGLQPDVHGWTHPIRVVPRFGRVKYFLSSLWAQTYWVGAAIPELPPDTACRWLCQTFVNGSGTRYSINCTDVHQAPTPLAWPHPYTQIGLGMKREIMLVHSNHGPGLHCFQLLNQYCLAGGPSDPALYEHLQMNDPRLTILNVVEIDLDMSLDDGDLASLAFRGARAIQNAILQLAGDHCHVVYHFNDLHYNSPDLNAWKASESFVDEAHEYGNAAPTIDTETTPAFAYFPKVGVTIPVDVCLKLIEVDLRIMLDPDQAEEQGGTGNHAVRVGAVIEADVHFMARRTAEDDPAWGYTFDWVNPDLRVDLSYRVNGDVYDDVIIVDALGGFAGTVVRWRGILGPAPYARIAWDWIETCDGVPSHLCVAVPKAIDERVIAAEIYNTCDHDEPQFMNGSAVLAVQWPDGEPDPESEVFGCA